MTSNDVKELISAWEHEQAKLNGVAVAHIGTSSQFPFVVAAFIKRWGVDNAKGIVSQAFAMPHNGRFNGRWLGEELFQSHMGTYHEQLYQEWLVGCSDDISRNFL